jgi:alpha/beta superfamily hydrolase
VAGHKVFLVLADQLTRQGIAVLRFDDRGVGRSGGDFKTATSEDFADDANAAYQFIKSRAAFKSSKLQLENKLKVDIKLAEQTLPFTRAVK